MSKKNHVVALVLLFFITACSDKTQSIPIVSIAPTEKIDTDSMQKIETQQQIKLSFAGDLMAHNVNYRMNDFSLIYDDVYELFSTDDLSFINLEAPVVPSKPYQTYPLFSMQAGYVEAAINAGFDVFSLANNHSNDQGIEGIKSTMSFFDLQKERFGTFSSGLKEGKDAEVSYELIKKNDISILFVAVTELLNRYGESTSYINYFPYNETGKTDLCALITALKQRHPVDLCIISIHTADAEYVREVSAKRKKHFKEILSSGVDIIWAHHPHVLQEWEIIDESKVIMYSMGNFLSGQRYSINKEDPAATREYTGDSVIVQITAEKDSKTGTMTLKMLAPLLITNYTDERKNVLVRLFSNEFIENVPEYMTSYYQERHTLMKHFFKEEYNDQ